MATETEVRRWGNSLGVLLPKGFVDEQHIKEHDKILIAVVKKADLSHLFGTLKTKMTGQEFKDLVRKGWDK